MAQNNFDAQLFLESYRRQKQGTPQVQGHPQQPQIPQAGFNAEKFLESYNRLQGNPVQPVEEEKRFLLEIPQFLRDPLGVRDRQEEPAPAATQPVTTPQVAPAQATPPVAQPEGLTVQERLGRMNQAWELGMAAAQSRSAGYMAAANEVLAETIDPIRNQVREQFGMEPIAPQEGMDTNTWLQQTAEQTVREITKDYQPMKSGDVSGVLSGVQYAGEMIAQSAPAMLATLAGGAMGPIVSYLNVSGEAHDELLEAVPDMSKEQRVALASSAGLAMTSLELLGLGVVFRGLTPGAVSRLAMEGKLAEHLQKQGMKSAASRILQAGIAEGSTELIQEGILMGTGAAAGGEYGRAQVTERLREAFFGGAAAGGGLRTAVELLPSGPRNEEPVVDVGGITDEDLGVEGDTPQLPGPDAPPLGLPAPGQEVLTEEETTGRARQRDQRLDDAGRRIAEQLYQETRAQEPVTDETVRQIMMMDSVQLDDAITGIKDIARQLDRSEPDFRETLFELQKSMRALRVERDLRTRADYETHTAVGDVFYDDTVPDWARAFVDQVRKDTGLDKAMIVAPMGGLQQHWADAAKWMVPGVKGIAATSNGRIIVGFDPANKIEALETLAHEIGHVLEGRMLSADPDLRASIIREYLDYFTPGLAPSKSYISRTSSRMQKRHGKTWLRSAEQAEKASGDMLGVSSARQELDTPGHYQDEYSSSFREWFADQVAKHLTTNAPGTTVVDQFFKRVADLWRAVIKHMKSRGYTGGSVGEAYDRIRAARAGVVDTTDGPTNSPISALVNPLGFGGPGGRRQADERAVMKYADNETEAVTEEIVNFKRAAQKLGVKNVNTGEADYYSKLVKYGWNVIQLAKRNSHIQWLNQYVQHASRWHAEKMKWMAHANETVKKWNHLSPRMQDNLAGFIFDLEHMNYRKPHEVANGVVRRPTRAEFTALAKAHKLNNEAAKVYLQVRKDFDAMLNEIESVAMAEIDRALANNPIRAGLEKAEAAKEFAEMRRKPYFPHSRFGKFTIITKDKAGKTVYMEAFDRKRDRDSAMRSVRKRFPSDHTVSRSQLSEEGAVFQGLPPTLLLQLKNTLNLSAQQEADLEQLLVQASPAMSFKNHFARRKDVAGYSTDALRAYSDYFWHGANHIARIKYAPLLQQSIQDGKDDISKLHGVEGSDTTKRVQINDHLQGHYDQLMNPRADWAALRSVGFLWWLGFNVKSALLNFTQVPMVTYTHLAAQFGDASVTRSMAIAMKEFQTLWRNPEKHLKNMKPEDSAMITKGIEMGFLDESFAMELAGLAEGYSLLSRRAGSRIRQGAIQFQHMAGYMFQAVEKLNRRVTFTSAIDLARRNPNAEYVKEIVRTNDLFYQELLQAGWTPTDAAAFLVGRDAVNSTQFEYSAWARPRVMQGGLMGTVLTFFMFTQNMLWFIQNNPGNTRYLALLLLTAGVMGLPGAEDLNELIKGIGAKLHKDWNMDRELRQLLQETWGATEQQSDMVLNGVSRYGFGLPMLSDMTGLPLPSVDMSANISMGSPLPIISPTLQAFGKGLQGKDFKDTMAELTEEGVGPTIGIPIGIIKALADTKLAANDPKRWEPAAPAAVSSLSKAWRYYTEGEERMRGGASLMDFERDDPHHMAEIIVQGLGFNPTRKSLAWDTLIAQREAGLFWMTRRGVLLNRLDMARQSGDKERVQEALNSIFRYNKQVPHPQLSITRDSRERSRKARETARRKAEAGLPQAKMLTPVYREVKDLYPDMNKPEPTESSTTIESLPSGR